MTRYIMALTLAQFLSPMAVAAIKSILCRNHTQANRLEPAINAEKLRRCTITLLSKKLVVNDFVCAICKLK